MPLYREDNFLVVHPGSQHTIFSFGLQESLSPPQYKIPSVVYQDPTSKEFKAKREEGDEGLVEVYPVQDSRVADLDAFNYLLKVILQSVIHNNPIITINQIPLLLVIPSLGWSKVLVESIAKYAVESLEFTAFNILDLSVASTFGLGSVNSMVVNVGSSTVQAVPVLSNQAIKFAGKLLTGIGAKTINEELKKLLPQFTEQQIEDLKLSGIYEVVNNNNAGSFYSMSEINDEQKNGDDFDVAKLVTETNGDIPDIKFDKKEGEEEEEEPKSNRELEKNSFTDSVTGEAVLVGKERFQGSSTLINAIAETIYKSLALISDSAKRQECYDNLIFVGSTFKIPGFKDALLIKLTQDYLVVADSEDGNEADTQNKINTAIAAYQSAEELEVAEQPISITQVPNSIKLAKHPEYFPEWKKPKETNGSWEDVYFLGGQIYAKQIFGANSNHGREMFLDTDIYKESGPQGIWDVSI